MPPLRRLVLGLNAATVLLVLAGLVLLAVPFPLPTASADATIVASAGALPDSVRSSPAPDVGAADRVLKTDFFSSRRTATPLRSMFGEVTPPTDAMTTDLSAAPAVAGEPVDSAAAAASTANDAVPHLYGTMLGPNESTALLRLDTRITEPRLYRVGDRAGGYRVTDIADRSVTLAGPKGRVVLRMEKSQQ
jgi:hypothetical protein